MMNRRLCVVLGLWPLLLGAASTRPVLDALGVGARHSRQQGPAETLPIPPEARAGPTFDAVQATNAYLATIPAAARARSDAYFEGGYWLILWDFLYASAVSLLLLNLRWSARMRDLAVRTTHFPIHRRRNGSRLPA